MLGTQMFYITSSHKPVSNYPYTEDYYHPYIKDEDTEHKRNEVSCSRVTASKW